MLRELGPVARGISKLVNGPFLKNRNCEFQFFWVKLKGITSEGIALSEESIPCDELIPIKESISTTELIPRDE